MKLKPLNEQVMVVFGASRGIGRETALRAAARGARVVVTARSEDGLASLVDDIRAAGGEATAVPAETADYEQVKAVAEAAVSTYGRLDTWVHLAAVSVYAPFAETTPSEFRQIIEVNLLGQAYGAMAALPYLKQNGGALIHISSVEAEQAIPLHSAYAASKHGVKGFVDALRMELAAEDAPVSVTNILPASINTPFFSTARTKLGVKPRGVPPMYEPELVANAILYAAEHPVRELLVGGAGKMLVVMQRLAPRLTEALLTKGAIKFQKTDEPKSANAPNNLFAPQVDDQRVQGDFSGEARSWSVYTWLAMHPAARMALGAVLLSGIGAMVVKRGGIRDL